MLLLLWLVYLDISCKNIFDFHCHVKDASYIICVCDGSKLKCLLRFMALPAIFVVYVTAF